MQIIYTGLKLAEQQKQIYKKNQQLLQLQRPIKKENKQDLILETEKGKEQKNCSWGRNKRHQEIEMKTDNIN